jgi:hypothetical protein
VPDRLSVEVALDKIGVNANEASWLGGETWWRTEEDGQTRQRHRLGWTLLSGRSVLETESFEDAECAILEGRDPIPGTRQVHLYSSSVTEDVRMNAAVGQQPGIVLASTAESEIAMVALRPGDQVLVVDAENNRTGRRAELVELRRGQRMLQLKRNGEDPEVCYGDVEMK